MCCFNCHDDLIFQWQTMSSWNILLFSLSQQASFLHCTVLMKHIFSIMVLNRNTPRPSPYYTYTVESLLPLCRRLQVVTLENHATCLVYRFILNRTLNFRSLSPRSAVWYMIHLDHVNCSCRNLHDDHRWLAQIRYDMAVQPNLVFYMLPTLT